MNSACPRWPSSWSTTALTTCTLAMPPLPIHILWPSMIQSSSVAARRGAQVADVAAALGFGDRQRGELEIAGRAEAFRRPLQHLLGRRGLADRRQRQRGHHDRQADARAAPEQLLHEHRQRQPGRVADQVAVEQRAVEARARPLPPAPATGTPGAGRTRAATGRTTCSANSWVRRARSCWAMVGVRSKLIAGAEYLGRHVFTDTRSGAESPRLLDADGDLGRLHEHRRAHARPAGRDPRRHPW